MFQNPNFRGFDKTLSWVYSFKPLSKTQRHHSNRQITSYPVYMRKMKKTYTFVYIYLNIIFLSEKILSDRRKFEEVFSYFKDDSSSDVKSCYFVYWTRCWQINVIFQSCPFFIHRWKPFVFFSSNRISNETFESDEELYFFGETCLRHEFLRKIYKTCEFKRKSLLRCRMSIFFLYASNLANIFTQIYLYPLHLSIQYACMHICPQISKGNGSDIFLSNICYKNCSISHSSQI